MVAWVGGPQGLPAEAGREEELPSASGPGRGSPRGFSGAALEAPGHGLVLLLAARLKAGSGTCSDNINKYNSSHGESLVFTVNSASKQRHRFVFCSSTPFIILCFSSFPSGRRDAFFFSFEAFPSYPPHLPGAGSWLGTCRTGLPETPKAAETRAASVPGAVLLFP